MRSFDRGAAEVDVSNAAGERQLLALVRRGEGRPLSTSRFRATTFGAHQRRWWSSISLNREAPKAVQKDAYLDCEPFFLANLELIEAVIRFTVHRYQLNESEGEELKSTVMIKLIDNDYAVIRKFRGQSSFKTFIVTVVANALKDYRTHQLGKFRPSPEAKRRGPCAVELDRLLYRDHRTLDEAIPILLQRFPDQTRENLIRLAEELPEHRERPRPVDIPDDVDFPATDDSEERVLANDRLKESQRLSRILSDAIAQWPKVDRQMLTLHFKLGMSVAEIARSLGIEQKLLYPRMTKVKNGLRQAAESAGFNAGDTDDLIGKEGLHLDFGLITKDEGPSTDWEEKSRHDSDDADDES
jgi:RNA polymerase sigma factor for flagellar operon FliA